MIDREMLELAAKAAGHTVAGLTDDGTALLLYGVQRPWNPRDENPHSDCNGDALRLAVKLHIQLDLMNTPGAMIPGGCVTAGGLHRGVVEHWFNPGGDPYAATRRAITRAAAEIGRSMS